VNPCEPLSGQLQQTEAARPRHDGRAKDTKEVIMADSQLMLTAEEHDFLAGLLEVVLRDMRVEEHRTRTPSYREHIIHREELIASLLRKLGRVAQ
jgi:hypothetical protein